MNATPALPPADVDAETMLLSCILIDGAETLIRCQTAGLTPASFYEPKHGIVFERLLGLHADQQPIAVETLAAELKSHGQLDQIGGWGFLAQVSGKVSTTAQAAFFVQNVREKAMLRAIIIRAERVIADAHAVTDDFAPVANSIERLSEVMSARSEARTWSQAVKEAEALTRERMKPPEERKITAELSWGIPDFDRLFQPLECGELVVIGGYTSSGKSSLLREIAWAVGKAGHGSLIQTLEVRDAEEAINLAGHISGHRSRARLHDLHPKDQKQLLDAFTTMNLPHFGVCHQDSNTSQILARARAFKRKHGLRFLGVDYLQILEDVKQLRPGERPDFAIGVVTSALKRFATQEETTVCLLSGFNRNYVRDGNRDPILSDLDGSSNIEKDASRVLLIHVPTEYSIGGAAYTQSLTADAGEQPRFFVKIIQAKGRNQGTGALGMMFHRESKTFQQISHTRS
jgi:replicative DNA helicase